MEKIENKQINTILNDNKVIMKENNVTKKDKCGLKRVTIDKFYTNTNIVALCIDLFHNNIIVNKTDLIIEPSAGNGSFSIPLTEKYTNVKAYDLYPEHESIIKQDYLKLDITKKDNMKIHVIGNPPFGRQSTLGKQFILKSALFADSISFILPKSFKKDSFIKTFPLNFHIIISEDLPENSFNVDGKVYDVPCVFQIWQKQLNKRAIPDKIVPPDNITYVKKTDNPTVSIRRVGVYAGKINKNFENDSIQSHYFLKIQNVIIDDFIKKYNENNDFKHDNTVGPKSLSIMVKAALA